MEYMKIFRSHTPEAVALAFAAIIGGGGWILNEVYRMNATLSAIDTKTDDTKDRLDRIAAVLPDVGVRVAEEELARPINVAVIAATPIEKTPGNWVSPIHFIDVKSRTRSTYLIPVRNAKDMSAAYFAMGAASAISKDSISFSDLEKLSADVGKNYTSPAFIMAPKSLALSKVEGNYAANFSDAIKNYSFDVTLTKFAFDPHFDNWVKLSSELNRNSSTYSSVKGSARQLKLNENDYNIAQPAKAEARKSK